MIQDTIHEALRQVLSFHLSKALSLLMPIFQTHTKLKDSSEIEDIANAFNMMLHYMRQNADDPERKKLYHNLLRRTYRVAADLEISWRCKNNGFYITQFQKASHLNMSPDFIRTVLETFVSDVAMLSLNYNGDSLEEKKNDIYSRHQTFIERLFAAITTSCQWSDGEREFWSEFLVSPTIDTIDAQLITSAISLSASNQFDPNKTRTLALIYKNATETGLKERALIGFVFSLKEEPLKGLFKELNDIIKDVTTLPETSHELLELQEQIFYCLNAERDKQKIEEEIMPGLTKNAPYRVTGTGMIEETPPDKMRDILHPDADDKAMEQIEQSMQKIADMQKQGADIYFGGFSHMKRFPFFSTTANWFMPYSPEQPDVAKVRQKVGKSNFIDLLISKSAFCESDKYSFTFAINAIYDRMPPNLREMINSSEAMGIEVPEQEVHTAAFIRRQYLQDLYRFFRLHPQRGDIKNVFDDSEAAFFFHKDYFKGTAIDKHRPTLAVFLYDQQRHEQLNLALQDFNDRQRDTFTYWILLANELSHNGAYGKAEKAYTKALEKAPDKEIALKGLARSAMLQSDYGTAAETYSKLLTIDPGHKSYLVNRGLALINKGDVESAAPVVYEADYRYPDDDNVKRVKAWLLLHQHKPEEAVAIYRNITGIQPEGSIGESKSALTEDYLNMGYALWMSHNIEGAAETFKTYLRKAQKENICVDFHSDSKLLADYGLDNDDISLMVELVEH